MEAKRDPSTELLVLVSLVHPLGALVIVRFRDEDVEELDPELGGLLDDSERLSGVDLVVVEVADDEDVGAVRVSLYAVHFQNVDLQLGVLVFFVRAFVLPEAKTIPAGKGRPHSSHVLPRSRAEFSEDVYWTLDCGAENLKVCDVIMRRNSLRRLVQFLLQQHRCFWVVGGDHALRHHVGMMAERQAQRRIERATLRHFLHVLHCLPRFSLCENVVFDMQLRPGE
mmetsp:Transcript_29469/g.80600  ORF Transcript_29469/g.80600 Transcript_29469/m.80600 type:complete len:225 (+) Transcript_29469:101-775(+)